MKPAIKQIGQVIDQANGVVLVQNWHFDCSNLPESERPKRLSAEQILEFLVFGHSPADGEMWSVDELREIQYQALELGLLDASEHQEP